MIQIKTAIDGLAVASAAVLLSYFGAPALTPKIPFPQGDKQIKRDASPDFYLKSGAAPNALIRIRSGKTNLNSLSERFFQKNYLNASQAHAIRLPSRIEDAVLRKALRRSARLVAKGRLAK